MIWEFSWFVSRVGVVMDEFVKQAQHGLPCSTSELVSGEVLAIFNH